MDVFLKKILTKRVLLFLFLILSFLLFSFYPTIFELRRQHTLYDSNREFILEHNYYWPDYNLYLSKIYQGIEGRWTAVEKYTSEPHAGSLIQVFYVSLGHVGKIFHLDPNDTYLLGRVILAPLLLLTCFLLIRSYFKNTLWQVVGFIITVISGSFPRFFTNNDGVLQVGRYMEWWSNIDALQRITFIPHILFGQIVSFYLFYVFFLGRKYLTQNKLIIAIILGNLVGLVFPPSLITLNSVIILHFVMVHIRKLVILLRKQKAGKGVSYIYQHGGYEIVFVLFSTLSLFYIFLVTRQLPWSSLVEFHRTHPMLIPFWEYILGTGPILFLGFAGGVIAVIKREKRFYPLLYFILVTFLFSIYFTHIKEQSPLRFTQTALFIPLGILGTYLFFQISKKITLTFTLPVIVFYILFGLYMMNTSLIWQTTWISQRIRANIPAVPYPPQAMYPLKEWMDGIRFLRDKTSHDDVVLAEVTAGNYIPAYSANTVYFGQSNTVEYEKKQVLVDTFYSGNMSRDEAITFLRSGSIKYIFFSIQEKEKAADRELQTIYPFLVDSYRNNTVTIYTY